MITLFILDLSDDNDQAYLQQLEINIIPMNIHNDNEKREKRMSAVQQMDLTHENYTLNSSAATVRKLMNQKNHSLINIPREVCVMENLVHHARKDDNYSQKLTCLHKLWLALKDRYIMKPLIKELNTNDSHLRETEY